MISKCHVCGKASPLFRQNEKGVPGIWACDEHNKKPVDPLVKEIVDAVREVKP